MASRVAILLLIVLASPADGEGYGEGRNLSDCAENFNTLEWALLHTKNNKLELRKAFYPPREEASAFVSVHYKFLDEDGTNITCEKGWLWSTIGFYLVQPPSIYQFTALFFNPLPRVGTANLFLPSECRNLMTWENGSCSCDSNGMLDVITQQLKLYAQFNNPNGIKIDDNSLALAVCDDEEYVNGNKIATFLSCGVIIPITFTLILALFIRSIREPMRVVITKPKNHAYLAALALTGMVFTAFVLAMDICALVFVVEGRHEFIMHTNISKEYGLLFVVITMALDALPILHSFIVVVYLRILAGRCCGTNGKFLRNSFEAYLYPIFGKIKATEGDTNHTEEFKIWIVLTLCFAPLFCIASHSVYIVVSWVSDVEHATSVMLLYMLSFLYYFIIFRHLYTVFIGNEPICPEVYLITAILKKIYNWLCLACNCFWCCCCRCTGKDSITKPDSLNEWCDDCSTFCCTCCMCYTSCLSSYEEKDDKCWGNKCYQCCKDYEDKVKDTTKDHELHSPIHALIDRNIKHSEASFNIAAFFIAIWIGLVLVLVEAVVIAGFVVIPVNLDTAPINIYHFVQLAFVFTTGLITYKFFNVGEGPKKILQAFLKQIRDLKPNANSPDDVSKLEDNEAAGRVIGRVAHTLINILPTKSTIKKDVPRSHSL